MKKNSLLAGAVICLALVLSFKEFSAARSIAGAAIKFSLSLKEPCTPEQLARDERARLSPLVSK